MKIPKVFHPILGILFGTTLFIIGIGVISVAFVATYKLVQYAYPYMVEAFSKILDQIFEWLPL